MLIGLIFGACSQKKTIELSNSNLIELSKFIINKADSQKVTLLEFGTDRCKPCVQMQKVIDEITHKYSKYVKVIYVDAWSNEEVKYARHFQVHTIPVQIFLDIEGKEFFRHLGYFPENEIVKVLEMKNIKIHTP